MVESIKILILNFRKIDLGDIDRSSLDSDVRGVGYRSVKYIFVSN